MWPLIAAFVATAAQAGERHFDIAPQQLASALREFGLQSGEQIAFRFETIASASTHGLHGTYEPEAALRKLLSGTDLSFRRSGEGYVVLRPSAAALRGEEAASRGGPATPAEVNPEQLEEVRVTASRVVRSGFTAPTPTTIVSSTQLQQRGSTNIGQSLNENPAFRATTTPQTNGVRAIFPGAMYADLRGLGASRTLVLVDGKRFVPQITTGLAGYQVDLNQIPSLLLERAEVVTGGASAQWGSDAVAGVVNLILKHDVQGVNVELQGGESALHDNQEYRAGVLAGTDFAEGRGHAQAAVDFVRNQGVGDTFTRDWGRQAWQIIANPCPPGAPASTSCPTGGNGQAANLILPDVRYATATRGGLINGATVAAGGSLVPSTLLRGMQFTPDGALVPFTYGNYVGTQNMQGGGSNAGLNFNTDVGMVPASTRGAIYSRLSVDLDDATEAYLEASYSYSHGLNHTLPARDTAIKVYVDNAFLPQSLHQYMIANHITSFDLGRSSGDIGFQEGDVVHETPRVLAGIEGALGTHWQWNAAYTYGVNHYAQRVLNDRVGYKFRAATDAVWVNGTIVCRSSVPGALNPEQGSAAPAGAPPSDPLAAGCVPLDVLGEGAPSAAGREYVTDTLRSETDYSQHAASFNVNGEPLRTWAGPVSLAAGLEWRSEHQRTQVDPQAELALYESTNAKSFSGNFSVREGYLESVMPLVARRAGPNVLDLNGAVRFTDYSTSGFVTTWKFGTLFAPLRRLLLRAVYSRDIRAPNLFELNSPPVSTVVNIRFRNAQPAVETLTSGNADLKPEDSRTLTLGAVWSDPAAGLQLSLDYFDIDVTGAIASLTSQQIADFCTAGQQIYCDRIQPDVHPFAAYTLSSPYLNFSEVERSGYDLAMSYHVPLSLWWPRVPGALTVNLSGTYVEHDRENAGNGFVERAGQSNVTPHVLSVASVTYGLARVMAMAQVRYVGHGKFDNTYVEGVNVNDNSVASATYLNLSGAVALSDRLQLFGVINNALDRDPPIDPASFGLPTTAIYFDTVGRSYRLGLRYRP